MHLIKPIIASLKIALVVVHVQVSVARTAPFLRSRPSALGPSKYQNKTRVLEDGAESIFSGISTCGKWMDVGQPIIGSSEYEFSGSSLASSADGRIIAIGAPYNSEKERHIGVVRVYRMNDKWEQIGQDIVGRAEQDLFGTSIAMSSNGRTMAVGSIGHNGYYKNVGKIKVFRLENNSWTKFGNIITGEEQFERVGFSVSMSSRGTIIAVSSSGAGSKTATTVYAYDRETQSWNQRGNSFVEDMTNELVGGASVSLSDDGSIVAIGNHLNSEKGKFAGYVRIFQFNSEELIWTQLGDSIYGKYEKENFGTSISSTTSGFTIAVGADGYEKDRGCVRIFDYQENLQQWHQRGQDILGESRDSFAGTSVSISSLGDIVAVGAVGKNREGDQSGHTNLYTYVTNEETWVQLGNSILGTSKSDFAGGAVELSDDGTTVAVAAPFYTWNGRNRGFTRVFKYSPFDSCAPSTSPTMVPSSMPTTEPSMLPTKYPSTLPSISSSPSLDPSLSPSLFPTTVPTTLPSKTPSISPSRNPSVIPTSIPTNKPSALPSRYPSDSPTEIPTSKPSAYPTSLPSFIPTVFPSNKPSVLPSLTPTDKPSTHPTPPPSSIPTVPPSNKPSVSPSLDPTYEPSENPSSFPSSLPTRLPSMRPTLSPTKEPSTLPSRITLSPTISQSPTKSPITEPSQSPSISPTSVKDKYTNLWNFLGGLGR